jgi:hypothetical protein
MLINTFTIFAPVIKKAAAGTGYVCQTKDHCSVFTAGSQVTGHIPGRHSPDGNGTGYFSAHNIPV